MSQSAACRCGATWGGHRIEHCPSCHESFTGTASGDAHRVGNHHDNTRRCLTPAEMSSRVNGKGEPAPMVRNISGHWRVDGPSPTFYKAQTGWV